MIMNNKYILKNYSIAMQQGVGAATEKVFLKKIIVNITN